MPFIGCVLDLKSAAAVRIAPSRMNPLRGQNEHMLSGRSALTPRSDSLKYPTRT